MKEKTIYIQTEKELRTYMHPLRQQILFELSLRPQGMTAKQLADALGIAPSSAGHHLGKLEQMGLVELTRTEMIHGFCAKFYKAADVTVNINAYRSAPLMQEALLNNNTAQQLQRVFDVAAQMQPGEEKANPLLASSRYSAVYLTQREAQEFADMLTRFFHAHSTPEQAGEGAHLYEISMLSTDLTVWQQLKKK
ncbi:MAG: ArsR/SmtB family transcription factor [Ruthenibacterium sp.]